MDTDELVSMTVQVILGVPKEDSPYVTDDESSALWDQIEQDVADNPDVQHDLPHEIVG
jgi:hypothetical protein